MSIFMCAHCGQFHDADYVGCQEAPEYGKFAMVSDDCRAAMDEDNKPLANLNKPASGE